MSHSKSLLVRACTTFKCVLQRALTKLSLMTKFPKVEVEEEEPQNLPERVWPTLEEYKRRWADGLAYHSRPVAGEFSKSNLIPEPIPQLWQDVPYVPFDRLKTEDAVARLSRCRPISGFRESHCDATGTHYAHCYGEVNFRRRQPLQLASTLGFILSKRSGKFMRLKPDELAGGRFWVCDSALNPPPAHYVTFWRTLEECEFVLGFGLLSNLLALERMLSNGPELIN